MKLGNDRGQGFQARRMKNEMSQNTGMHTIVVGSSTSLKHAAYIICAEGIWIIIQSGLVYGRAGSHMGRRRCRTSWKQLPTVDMHMFLEPFFLVRIVEERRGCGLWSIGCILVRLLAESLYAGK